MARKGRQFLKKLFAMAGIAFFMFFLNVTSTYASGSGNVDIGGGGLNQGVSAYNWPGNSYQGIRVTVVNAATGEIVGNPMDYTNKDISLFADQILHFGNVSKNQYRNGATLTLQTAKYICKKPNNFMPLIISSNSSKASIEQIKRYFCSEGVAALVAAQNGINVSLLTDGSHKLVIEPVIYLIYNNLYYAMTTTEAGLYNRMLGGDLGAHFPTVVMKNLALALFLEKDDLGFTAWTGSTTTARTTEEMIERLGIGIISYKGAPATEATYDVTYRVDTDVITAVTLSTGNEINNSAKATVTFTMAGRSYQMTDIVLPKNGSQIVWVKWHTPPNPQEVTINISTNKGQLSNSVIHANVVDMAENPPPDPQADDRNDGFTGSSVPTGHNVTSRTWGVWNCWWHADWVWMERWEWVSYEHSDTCEWYCTDNHGEWIDHGKWEDHGWYDYGWTAYSATLSATTSIVPDEKNPTAGADRMKSGYGINMVVQAQVSSGAPSGHITEAQTCVAYFPEFLYRDYWRLLERTTSGYSAVFEFKENEYSTYNRRSHFSPVWFPDGEYRIYGQLYDAWCPAGMMQIDLTDSVTIDGNLFSDWHIRQG
jgi:hypothetical protein